jgi:transcriptional regulator with XRE-family HTH domain
MNEFLKKMRTKNNQTQDNVAKVLDISRQTYSLLESGEKEITINQIEKLSDFYEISKIDFIYQKERKIEIKVEQSSEQNDINQDIRISVPQKNINKFKEVLLYILTKVGNKFNVGQTVIYKLLYFIDFDFYEKYEEQLIGITYIKNKHGPTPVEFKKVVEDMKEKGELEEVESKYFDKNQTKYLPLREYNLKNLTAIEIQHIDDELARLSDKNANEISELSHKDIPWIVAEDRKPIDYESVFYRTQDTSVRSYKNDL